MSAAGDLGPSGRSSGARSGPWPERHPELDLGSAPAPPSTPGRASDEDRLARAAIASIAEPGDRRLSSVVDDLGAIQVLRGLSETRGHDEAVRNLAERLLSADPERDLDRAARLGIRFVVPGDDEWPDQLGDLIAAESLQNRGGQPLGLWVKGPLRLDTLGRSIAMVGSRSATSYGDEAARELAATTGREGWCVVSGAAFGIDQSAHRGAIAAGGRSVAVLACGADRIYPASHKALLDYLAAEGAVISEAPPGWSPTRIRFLARNRLIAALTRGTVVVEAAVRSGALNTANWAARLNRPLMGVPGSITSAPSQGVHQLIRNGVATLVTSGSDILELVSDAGEHLAEEPRGRERPRDRLSSADQQILDAVPVARPAQADSIARTAGLGLLAVHTALRRLDALALVEHSPEGWCLSARAHT